jgi:AraC-like DNA-binding protein
MQRQVKIAQTRLTLKETRFENERLARLGIEVMSIAYLRKRTTRQALCLPERVDFYMLMLITNGAGLHTIDSTDWPVVAGDLIIIRPGQVQQWHVEGKFAAQLVLFDPAALDPAPKPLAVVAGLEDCPARIRLPRAGARRMLSDLAALKAEIQHYDKSELTTALIRHMLVASLLRLVRSNRAHLQSTSSAGANRRTYRLFLRKLETDFRKEHRLHYYARRLGYSASTLRRACVAAEGRSAKAVIDRRIALEAQRLLIHSSASLVEVAHYLGFSEATNFAKFFARVVGREAAAFRGESC